MTKTDILVAAVMLCSRRWHEQQYWQCKTQHGQSLTA